MTAHELRGLAASPGVAVGCVVVLEAPDVPDEPHRGRAAESAAALAALDGVAAALAERADRLRSDGLGDEATILESSRLMALDPVLRGDVDRLTTELPAASALEQATDRHARALASLDDPMLAARAADVRELGRRAVRHLVGGGELTGLDEPSVLVAADLGPADVAEVRASGQPIVAIALAGGAATSHAAIMARSLGLPMVVAAGDRILRARNGATIVVDGDAGRAQLDPHPTDLARARRRMADSEQKRRRYELERALPPVTRDGHWMTLLGNAATRVEVQAALEAEADGIGLLRTELAFLEATTWPTEDEHVTALAPLLHLLSGFVSTVRVLDFGGDKTPPFLAGTPERGVTLLLEHPDALAAQLRAILRSAADTELRVLIPLVESAEQLRAVTALLRQAAVDAGWTGELPAVGAMIETPAAVTRSRELAEVADFLSIGTNDLVQYTLGLDRMEPLANARSAADPVVLRLIARTVESAHAAGVTVEVCGESASVPELAALYVGLGVDELSAAPARLDELRSTVRALSADEAAETARRALDAESADAALALAASLVSGERGDQLSQLFDGLDSIRA